MAELSGENVADRKATGVSDIQSTFNPRAYQLEMLEESMRRNIIVAVRLP